MENPVPLLGLDCRMMSPVRKSGPISHGRSKNEVAVRNKAQSAYGKGGTIREAHLTYNLT